MTVIYALSHMAVDFSCAYLIYAYVTGANQWYFLLLLYNFCAFALQMPFGVLADRLDHNSRVAAGSCLGVLAGLALGAGGHLAAAAAAAGIGNACFHVGGGIDVLNKSEKRAAPLGIFVAPGALGIFAGGILGKSGYRPAVAVGLLLAASAVMICLAAGRAGLWNASGNAPFSLEMPAPLQLTAVLFLFLTVVLRSYSGMVQSFPWKGALAGSGLILTGAVVLGKMAGGIFADRIGMQKAAVRSMCAAAVGFLCLNVPAAGILAVFCWNMSMPLTLWAVARSFPGAKGFGFGLLTFGLFLGFCPVYSGGGGEGANRLAGAISSPVGLALMAAVSLVLLSFGLKRVKG